MSKIHHCSGCGGQGHNISSCKSIPGREGKTRCATCKEWLQDSDFNVKNHRTGQLQRLCKECIRPYKRRWYRKHHQEQVERTTKNRLGKKEVIRKMKGDTPCKDCGRVYHWFVMDFDHLVEGEKESTIAKMLQNNLAIERILTEISKCDLVCSNCHRIRTWNRLTPEKRESIRQAVLEGHRKARAQGVEFGAKRSVVTRKTSLQELRDPPQPSLPL
jgi:hypothetical protein